jgi:hypothetical protein
MGANLWIVKKHNPATIPLGNTMRFHLPFHARNRVPGTCLQAKKILFPSVFLLAMKKDGSVSENPHTQVWEML